MPGRLPVDTGNIILDYAKIEELYPIHPALNKGRLERHEMEGRWRWPRRGARRAPNARRPKPCAPEARAGLHERWIASVTPPGVARSKPKDTARGTPERRRTCGFIENRAASDREMSSCLVFVRGSGPRVRQDPGVPRALIVFGRDVAITARARTRRGNAGGCFSFFPSPLAGEGAGAKRRRERGSLRRSFYEEAPSPGFAD